MMTINIIQTFIRKNMTPCRVFWGFMYTLYFMVGWVSFYYTKMCNDYMCLIEWANKSKITILSMHVFLGLGVYGLLILVVPLVYLLHQAIKEIVENAKRVWGTDVVVAIYKFLVASTFPILSLCMSSFFRDTPSLWTCIGIVGSMYCLFICYVNPDDYGLSDGFFALGMAILLNLNNNIGKYVILAILGVSLAISKEIAAHKKLDDKKGAKKAQVLKPSIKSANNSFSVKMVVPSCFLLFMWFVSGLLMEIELVVIMTIAADFSWVAVVLPRVGKPFHAYGLATAVGNWPLIS
ncbi:hypothetical protein BUALT_BualtUnG0001000 [Buddleja alternifolia]|uniref:Uncharacterized protein n=1 Tax=Buddleja alternifolia TaxID=168488 RepID=A0AAV6W0D5_9LAMI|nr:hypothetical protein BUALT_BualtUnG0001000 [Buddleja alternifolia]